MPSIYKLLSAYIHLGKACLKYEDERNGMNEIRLYKKNINFSEIRIKLMKTNFC